MLSWQQAHHLQRERHCASPSYLQLFLVEGLEQVLRNHLVEAFLQGQELSLDAVQESPVHIQPADAETELCFIFIILTPTSCGRLQPSGLSRACAAFPTGRIPSWCPPRRGCSCRWVWARAGWSLRTRCALRRKCGPGRRWCHCPWEEEGGRSLGKHEKNSKGCFLPSTGR